MKLLPEVEKILDKYNLDVNIPDYYKNIDEYLEDNEDVYDSAEFDHPLLNDRALMAKYIDYIPDGWYGFAIGHPTPYNWNVVINLILELCIKHDPNFRICQIKMKWGGIRFYCESDVIEDLMEIQLTIGDRLYSQKLIY